MKLKHGNENEKANGQWLLMHGGLSQSQMRRRRLSLRSQMRLRRYDVGRNRIDKAVREGCGCEVHARLLGRRVLSVQSKPAAVSQRASKHRTGNEN